MGLLAQITFRRLTRRDSPAPMMATSKRHPDTATSPPRPAPPASGPTAAYYRYEKGNVHAQHRHLPQEFHRRCRRAGRRRRGEPDRRQRRPRHRSRRAHLGPRGRLPRGGLRHRRLRRAGRHRGRGCHGHDYREAPHHVRRYLGHLGRRLLDSRQPLSGRGRRRGLPRGRRRLHEGPSRRPRRGRPHRRLRGQRRPLAGPGRGGHRRRVPHRRRPGLLRRQPRLFGLRPQLQALGHGPRPVGEDPRGARGARRADHSWAAPSRV